MRRVALAAAVAAVVIGGTLAYAGRPESSSPQDVVRDYFAAVARGDAAGALALGDVPSGTRDFLTADVLREQLELASLRDIRVGSVSGDSVAYTYQLRFAAGSERIAGAVGVVERDGRWRLVAAAVPTQLQLSGASSRATLAGAALPSGVVALFPGAVPLRFDTENLSAGTANLTFGADAADPVTVGLSARGRAAAGTAAKALLAGCFDRTAPPQCPLPADPRVVPGSLRGRLSDVRLGYAVAATASGSVVVSATPTFTGAYRQLDDDNIAHARSGSFELVVHASAPATDLGALRWSTP